MHLDAGQPGRLLAPTVQVHAAPASVTSHVTTSFSSGDASSRRLALFAGNDAQLLHVGCVEFIRSIVVLVHQNVPAFEISQRPAHAFGGNPQNESHFLAGQKLHLSVGGIQVSASLR